MLIVFGLMSQHSWCFTTSPVSTRVIAVGTSTSLEFGPFGQPKDDGSPGDYVCKDCGYVFTKGPKAWAALGDNYKCPPCGAPKFRFKKVAKGSSSGKSSDGRLEKKCLCEMIGNLILCGAYRYHSTTTTDGTARIGKYNGQFMFVIYKNTESLGLWGRKRKCPPVEPYLTHRTKEVPVGAIRASHPERLADILAPSEHSHPDLPLCSRKREKDKTMSTPFACWQLNW
eukprot:scaffold6712_cov142-Cylindrotheca_fusiformis.AAC.3